MEMVFLRVLNMSITASFLLAAVIVLRFAIKKKCPKWIFCVLWALAAVRLVCPFTVESPLSLIPDRQIVTERGFWVTEDRGVLATEDRGARDRVQGAPGFRAEPNETEADISDGGGLSGSPEGNTAEIAVTVKREGAFLFRCFGVIWLCGVAVFVGYAAISYRRLRRRTAASAAVGKRVWESDDICTPFVLGVVRPRIYLPSDLDPAQAEYVLAHERMHLKRHDHWWKPLGFMILSVHWFNPLCWLSYILFCRDIELACDEGVVREKNEPYRKSYAEALLACSVGQKRVNACPLAFGETDVKERVGHVMNYKKPAFWVILTAIAACLAVAVCFLTNPQKKEEQTQNIADSENTDGRTDAAGTDPGGENGEPEIAQNDAGQDPAENGQGAGNGTLEPVGDEQENGNGTQGNEDGAEQNRIHPVIPDIVREQARQYVQAAFDQAAENYQNAVPAGNAYTEWRIQSVEHCYTYDHIAGMMCEIYRLNYEFLAEAPEEVVLAGGMQMSEDGWVVPESPNSQYLVFRRDGDALTFFCSMYENDCMPGDELFTSDLINYCFELGMYDESEGFNPNGRELLRRFKEVDIETLHAIPFTQDITGDVAGYFLNGGEEPEKMYGKGILCLGELPEYGIRLYGYNDEDYWRQGVAVEIGDDISYFDWGYMTPRVQFPNLYWDEEKQRLQITLPIYTGTSFAAQKLIILQYDKDGGLEPYYFRLEDFTPMINEILGYQFEEESGTLTLLDQRTGEEAGIARLPGEEVYGIWSGDISEFVLGDTIRFRVTPGYLTDAATPQYDNMPAVEFEVEIPESEQRLSFSIGGLY